MTIIIVSSLLIISISLILVGLRMNMVQSERENQNRLNERILSSLPDNFRLDQ